MMRALNDIAHCRGMVSRAAKDKVSDVSPAGENAAHCAVSR
jgi:hypothetical protein